MTFSEECDIGEYFRQWMIDIPEIAAFCGDDIVDTIPEGPCRKPFIWYCQEDANETDALCEGFDDYDYTVEIIAPELLLPKTRRIKSVLSKACQNYERGDAFGDPQFQIQSLEVMKLRDGHVPTVVNFIDGVAFSILAVRITP